MPRAVQTTLSRTGNSRGRLRAHNFAAVTHGFGAATHGSQHPAWTVCANASIAWSVRRSAAVRSASGESSARACSMPVRMAGSESSRRALNASTEALSTVSA
jgi:hypothetical protein